MQIWNSDLWRRSKACRSSCLWVHRRVINRRLLRRGYFQLVLEYMMVYNEAGSGITGKTTYWTQLLLQKVINASLALLIGKAYQGANRQNINVVCTIWSPISQSRIHIVSLNLRDNFLITNIVNPFHQESSIIHFYMYFLFYALTKQFFVFD